MASIAFHSRVVFADVYTEGITKITAADIAYAKEFDSVIKLLGVARNTPEGIEVGVYPEMQWTMRCSTEEAQERCRRQARL